MSFVQPEDFSLRYGSLGTSFYGQPGLGINYNNTEFTDKFTEELRLTSSGNGNLNYVGGLFYSHELSFLNQNISATDPRTGVPLIVSEPILNNFIPTTYSEVAAYLTATYRFNGYFDIALGARYSHIDQHYEETDYGFLGDGITYSGAAHGAPFTYSASPQFHLTPDMMLYGRISTGYRAGGPNTELPPSLPQEFKPDTTVNYELGYKAQMFDRRLTAELSLFYIDWKNIQEAVIDPTTGELYFTNGGTAVSKGFEADVAYAPFRGLSLAGTLAYTDATLAENTSSDSTIYGVKGDELPFVPKWASTLSADYQWALGNRVRSFVGFTLSYTDARETDFVSKPSLYRVELPAFTTADFRLGVDYDRYKVTLFVKNANDAKGYVGSQPLKSAGAPYELTLINPRTVGVSLAAKF